MFVFFVNFFSAYCLILLLIYILFFGSLVVDSFSRQFATHSRPCSRPYSLVSTDRLLVHSKLKFMISDNVTYIPAAVNRKNKKNVELFVFEIIYFSC